VKVRILTPSEVVLDEEAEHVTAEDASGSLGIREDHATLVTALVPGIVRVRGGSQTERYVAVNGGMMLVNGNVVEIVSRQAVMGNDLASLEENVVAGFERDVQEDKVNRAAFEKLRLSFLRGVVEMDKA
jgi:F-type H+-transporting ATPase subunit epsilon